MLYSIKIEEFLILRAPEAPDLMAFSRFIGESVCQWWIIMMDLGEAILCRRSPSGSSEILEFLEQDYFVT